VIHRFVPPLGLIAALAGAGMAAMWLLQTDPFPGPGTATASGALAPDGTDHFQLPAPSDADEAIRQFANRPLLAEGRKPFVPKPVIEPATDIPPPEPPPTVAEALPAPQIRMLGVLETGSVRRALIADGSTGQQLWLVEGDTIQGWTLTAVEDDQIRLQVDDAEITFNLFEEPLP
jgi:hypothetical protein